MRPVVTVPVLSSTIGVDLPGRLEHLGALDQDAELGAAAGADQQRGGRGQAQRAGAGDDQHRDGGGERRPPRRRPAPSQQPSVATAIAITIGTKTPETRSARRCTGALPVWASLDESGHLRELGVGADAGGAHDEAPAGVDGRADDGIARADLDGHRFAGQHATRRRRSVPSTTTPSVAIFSPGRTTNRSPTASWSIGMRDSDPVAQHRDVLGAEVEQRPQALRRTGAWPAPRSSGRRG